MSTGGLKVFSKKHFDPITFSELKKQVDDWNKKRGYMTQDQLSKLSLIVENQYDENEYLTLLDIEKIEKINRTNILKALKKYKIPLKYIYKNGSRSVIIVHVNDVEKYLKLKYGEIK